LCICLRQFQGVHVVIPHAFMRRILTSNILNIQEIHAFSSSYIFENMHALFRRATRTMGRTSST